MTLLTVPEAATRLTVQIGTIRKWVAARRLSHVRIGRLVRIPEAAIAEFLAAGYRPRHERGPRLTGPAPLAQASARLRAIRRAGGVR